MPLPLLLPTFSDNWLCYDFTRYNCFVSGILNSKSRVLDTMLTYEGRKQLASGKLRIEAVTLTDASAFYEADEVSGSVDASSRLYFESCNLPQDQISFLADDSGKLQPFANNVDVIVKNGQLLSSSYTPFVQYSVLTGSGETVTFLSGSAFTSTAGDLLQSALTNFQNLYTLSTIDESFGDDGFAVSVGGNAVEFTVLNDKPRVMEGGIAQASSLPGFFNDPRLSGAANFEFLPPLNKRNLSGTPSKLGNYSAWGNVNGDVKQYIAGELAQYDAAGFAKKITIDPSSKQNRLLGQFFELSNGTMTKLDVIDVGQVASKRYFFAGKIDIDEDGMQSFLHLFTLEFG